MRFGGASGDDDCSAQGQRGTRGSGKAPVPHNLLSYLNSMVVPFRFRRDANKRRQLKQTSKSAGRFTIFGKAKQIAEKSIRSLNVQRSTLNENEDEDDSKFRTDLFFRA